jgi:undecaprenyl-diphosphatase
MKDLTSLGGFTVLTLMTVAAIVYLLVGGKRRAALLLAAAVGGGALLSSGLKMLFLRPRPELVPHVVDVASASFPSGHALLAATTYLTLGALLARVQPQWRLKVYLFSVATALALAIGASRVYLGVHYPSDVLAGWAVGAAWAMSCWAVAAWLQRRGQVEGQPPELDADAAGADVEQR